MAFGLAKLFATLDRVRAQGALFFAAVVCIGLVSYFFPTLLSAKGVPAVGLLVIALVSLVLLIGAIWAPNSQGKTLQHIENERYGPSTEPKDSPTAARL